MGCCESAPKAPKEILEDPAGPSHFIVKKAGTFGDNFKVMNGEKKDWLFMDNDAGLVGLENGKIKLENFIREEGSKKGQRLAFLQFNIDKKIGTKREVDADSDDSDVEDLEYEAKLKWKITREVAVQNKDEQTVATLRSFMQGKSKAECRIIGGEKRTEVDTKVKKIEYTLKVGDTEMPLDTKQEKWDKEDRKWHCDAFDAEYDDRDGKDYTIVKTKEGQDPAPTLLLGFAAATFCHPALTIQYVEKQAKSRAEGLANITALG